MREEKKSFWARFFGGSRSSLREQKIFEYMVHRMNQGANLKDVVGEEYVRRNLSRSQIDDILSNPRIVVRKETHTRTQIGRGFGQVVSVLGILVALAGLLIPGDVGPLGLVGMMLGVLGVVLGAYRVGTAAVALSWVEILLGVLMS